MSATALRDAVRTIQALRARVEALQAERSPPIAVVGMACRFPGADGIDALWRLLEAGADAVRPVPPDRWDNAAWHSADPDAPGRVAFQQAAFLADVDGFDNDLFGISAREAAQMDPQHRIGLEVAWHAFEHAGLRPGTLAGAAAGVFLGLNAGDHLRAALSDPARVDTHALAGGVASLAAGRIAYALGLAGPALVVDTACSSSLVAVHLAVQALRHGECTLALAGGAHLMLTPHVSVALSRARMMAPDGRCKPFDAAADGFGQGEGCGMVVLKRLADATAAGDRVLAVIRGSALNQDGRSAGITAPSQGAQAAVIRAALADAGLDPAAIDAIEAHGTGTALGDPIELHALASVFGRRDRALLVGSVKANIGHTAAAAGVAGLIKAVLMLRHQAAPATPHFKRLNPHIEVDPAAISVVAQHTPAPLRHVGVSGFGFSGTNAHLVLQAASAAREPALAPTVFQRRHFPRVTITAVPETQALGWIDSPSADRQMECRLDLASIPWLADHAVQGRVIVPGALHIALMLATVDGAALADIVFPELLLLDDAPIRLVAVARPDGTLAVGSRSGTTWTWHATAALAESADPPPPPVDRPGESAWDRPAWIAHLAALGIAIGPSFQAITRIAPGPVCTATLDPSAASDAAAPFPHAHPALLDAVLQVAGGTLAATPVLPVRIARLQLAGPALHQATGEIHVQATRTGDSIDLVASAAGQGVAWIQGMQVAPIGATLPPLVAAPVWTPLTAPPGAATPAVFHAAPHAANLPEALQFLRTTLEQGQQAVLLTTGATPPVTDPAAAIFAGIASALAAERPELRCRCIDVAPGTPDAFVQAEIASASTEPLVALRPEGRFVPRLHALPRRDARLRLRGTALIAGGFGGIGRHAAAWAVDRGAEAVLLLGRTPAPFPHDLPGQGLAVDITAPGADALVAAALAAMPPLHTVIHTAGVLADGLIEHQTPQSFAAVIDPKLAGAQALHRMTAHLPVEHFLLFGSVASLIGAAGQSNYAAANAGLDAFAHWRHAQGLPATSIAWGRWAGTGMAATLDPAQTARVAARGLQGMTPAQALTALDRAVLSGHAVVMIAALDLPRIATTAPPVFTSLLATAAPAEPAGSVAARVAAAIRDILGQPVPAGQPLVACGLDSLMAMDLRNRLNRSFGIGLGLADLLGGADLASLVGHIENQVEGAPEFEEMTL
jgi:acyl transferase domain-containing protein/aryl carrier-like protein